MARARVRVLAFPSHSFCDPPVDLIAKSALRPDHSRVQAHGGVDVFVAEMGLHILRRGARINQKACARCPRIMRQRFHA